MAAPARVTTDLGAANLALSFCKEPPISAFDEPDRAAARAVSQWYGTALDKALRGDDWGFASAWTIPAMDPVAGIGRFKKRFPLKEDCVAVREVWNVDATFRLEENSWGVENAEVTNAGATVEAKILVTNTDAVNVHYTRRVLNVGLWDQDFLIAFAVALGGYVAPLIGRSSALAKMLKELADDEDDDAEEANAKEQARGTISRDTTWTRARGVSRRRFP